MSHSALETGNRQKLQKNDQIRIRKDIRSLTQDELDHLINAWIFVQNNEPDPDTLPDNPNTVSFFNIAGFHGEPFRGAGYSSSQWWGGYCNHGNVLFPTWHRAYLLCLENALQQYDKTVSIALPYWNEIDTDGNNPIPKIFLQKTYVFKNGKEVPNPLYSYKLASAIRDRLLPIPDADYSKYKGYNTVRYPFSGLVGTPDVATTDAHNSLMQELNTLKDGTTDSLLQSNVYNWLRATVINDQGVTVGGSTADNYIRSLFAPNYTVFSNTTSAEKWNDDRFDDSSAGGLGTADDAVMPLERPHNAVHLAVGGFEVPGIPSRSYIPDANGDMGENDTASFDPIFFFHHCFIDLVFWAWQTKHNQDTQLDLMEFYPGTNSVDSQGPTPGITGNTWLNLETPLNPFPRNSNASSALLVFLLPEVYVDANQCHRM
ncbi:hypothetical protein GP486_002619 [Trichoglossum hirsutum]|uniref:tyrosinase n=1 Tax=Trichoglossum hirsutum TaxID=265104 RepID=A0A9P8RRY3_9PEZI|nr:hypothetical protein GP486_002619 [Trichoglossum hirsutum]